jgi:hypothetical protein
LPIPQPEAFDDMGFPIPQSEAFNESFDAAYNSAGKAAGTYILRDGVWSRQ